MTRRTHDANYKALFSQPDMVRDLIAGFVPDAWLRGLDYSTLEKVSGSYVGRAFKRRESDAVWRVRVDDEYAYVYLLLEFQSSIDRFMAVRLMAYLGLLYQDLVAQKAFNGAGLLPPVLPIVLYNGDQRWTAAENVADLIPPVPGLLQRFRPQVRYLLIDEGRYQQDELASQRNLVAALFRIEHAPTPEALVEVVSNLADWLTDRPDMRRLFVGLVETNLGRYPAFEAVTSAVDDLHEVRTMLADRIKAWEQGFLQRGMREGMLEGMREGVLEGMRAGERKGKLEGEQASLLRLLTRKFGALSPAVTHRVGDADLAQVEAWFDRGLDMRTLDEVFGDDPAIH